MKHHFLPAGIAIAMTKQQFAFATGLSPYKLRKFLEDNAEHFAKLGYTKWDKLLMPAVTEEICAMTGLEINLDFFGQYVAGQRGNQTPIVLK